MIILSLVVLSQTSQTCYFVFVAIVAVPKLGNISYIWSNVQAAKTLKYLEKQVSKVTC